MTDLLDHAGLEALLRDHGALQPAAELHGFLAGQLAAGRRFSREAWLRATVDQADLDQQPDPAATDALYQLYQHTLATLADDDFDFAPLLAADTAPLSARVAGLGSWCQGFLGGFGLGGGAAANAEMADTLRDLAAIAQVGAEEDDSDASDRDLFAITEYVRLAVIDLFLQAGDTPPTAPASSAGTAPAATPADLFQRRRLH